MADTCAKCGRPRYPDARTYCERCSPFRSDRWMPDDAMLPLAIESQRGPQDYDEGPLVAGGQGRHPEDVTDAAMALRDLVLCCAGILAVMLIGWMVGRAIG